MRDSMDAAPLFYARIDSGTGMALILYQRDDCHLCDLALAVLAQARAPGFNSVFIDGDAALESRYGERVPVLRDVAAGRELGWPFDVATLRTWLACPL